MSRFFVCFWIFAVLIFACSKSSNSFDDAGASSGGPDASRDALSSSGSSGQDAFADVPPIEDAPFAVASAAVDASFSGDACDERLALKFGTISPPQLLPNRDPNGDGGDQVSVACTLDTGTGKYSITLGIASGVTLVVHGGATTTATLSNDTTTYAADSCVASNADIAGGHVIVTLTCVSTTVGGASSGSPAPSPCEMDVQLNVAGCTGP